MVDLDPQDIKDPDDEEAAPPIPPPPGEEDEDEIEAPEPVDEEEARKPDLAAVVEHLTTAVAELARSSGSPPAVIAAIERVRKALAK